MPADRLEDHVIPEEESERHGNLEDPYRGSRRRAKRDNRHGDEYGNNERVDDRSSSAGPETSESYRKAEALGRGDLDAVGIHEAGVKIGTFTSERQEDWTQLEGLVAKARGRPDRLPASDILLLGRLYRAAAADLSRLRSSHPDHPSTHQLAGLVTRARPLVYRSDSRRGNPVRFMTTTFWETCTERSVFLAVAAALLIGFGVLGWIWATVDTPAAVGIVPGEFSSALNPDGGTSMGVDPGMQAEFSTFLITNNVTVAVLAFGVGILFGVGTVFVLAQNGLMLGVVGGALVSGGNGGFFLELAAAHGLLELSCIVVSAAAGLRLGWALVHPGSQSRRAALAAEARPAVLMTVGVMPWLVVAGIIEAYVSRRGLSALPVTIVGVVVGGGFWLLMWLRRAPGAIRRHAV